MKPLDCPGINCNYACESCGFNPKEQKRRLSKGHFEKVLVLHILHNASGKPIHTVTKTCDRLVFKKGVSINE